MPLHKLEEKTIIQWGGSLAEDIKQAFCNALNVKKYEGVFRYNVLSDIFGDSEWLLVSPSGKNKLPPELFLLLGPAIGVAAGLAAASGQVLAERSAERTKLSPEALAAAAKDVVLMRVSTLEIRAKEVSTVVGVCGNEYVRWLYLEGDGHINGANGRISMWFGRESGTSLGRYFKPPEDWIGKFCGAIGRQAPSLTRGKDVLENGVF